MREANNAFIERPFSVHLAYGHHTGHRSTRALRLWWRRNLGDQFFGEFSRTLCARRTSEQLIEKAHLLRAPFGSGCGGGGLATLASFLALVNHNGRFFEGSLNFFKNFLNFECRLHAVHVCDERYAICDDMRRYAAAYNDMEQHTMQRYAKLSLQRFTTTCNAIQRYTTICNYM